MDFAIDKGLEIGVYLDDPVPEKLAASAGLNSYPIGIFWKVLPDGWEAQQFFLASFQPYKD